MSQYDAHFGLSLSEREKTATDRIFEVALTSQPKPHCFSHSPSIERLGMLLSGLVSAQVASLWQRQTLGNLGTVNDRAAVEQPEQPIGIVQIMNKMTLAQMLEMPLYHPVIEEGLRTALRELDVKLRAAQANVSKAA